MKESTGEKRRNAPAAPIALSVSDITEFARPPFNGTDRAEYRFKKHPGLVLRVTRSGKKTFYIHQRRDQGFYKEKLFDYPEDKNDQQNALKQLEQKFHEKLAVLRTTDSTPKEVQKVDERKKKTFGALFEQYMTDYARLQTKSWAEAEANYRRYFKDTWHTRLVSNIEPLEIQQWLNKLKASVPSSKGDGFATANRNYELFRSVIRWGMRKRAIELSHDPCLDVEKFAKISRERFLMPHEWETFKTALDQEKNPVMRDFFYMCLYTGVRSGNVMSMRWDDINWDLLTWTIPAARSFNMPGESTKNNQGQVVNLTPEALKVLNDRLELKTSDEWVFPARMEKGRPGTKGHMTEPKAAWKALLVRAGMYSDDKNQRLRLHDIRRTVGSYMAIQGVDTKIIGQVLGHRSAASTAPYARLIQSTGRAALENMQAALGDPTKLRQSAVNIDRTSKTRRKKRNILRPKISPANNR